MAHFNLLTDNSRRPAPNARGKQVSVSEPSHAHIRGWNAGVNVEVRQQDDGHDVFYVYMTSGSAQAQVSTLIGTVHETPNGPRWEPNPVPADRQL